MTSTINDLSVDKKMTAVDKELLMDYFRYTAYYLVAANEMNLIMKCDGVIDR